MFGLSPEQWQDLVLSVGTRRKERRLNPVEAGRLIRLALQTSSSDVLAKTLNFQDATTMHRIASLADLPNDLADVVDWRNRTGSISMSTASVLLSLRDLESIRWAFAAVLANSLTRDEARQLVQVSDRSKLPLPECLQTVLNGRPRVERQELVIGQLRSKRVQELLLERGPNEAARLLRVELARRFPEVTALSVRVSANGFSVLFSERDIALLRAKLGSVTISEAVNRFFDSIK